MSSSEPVEPLAGTDQQKNSQDAGKRRESFSSQNSQTAKEFIESQMRLEADAREILPYSFDSCTQALGPLRQILFACLTCNPPSDKPDAPHTSAGVCYSCSIACHGEHTLVELFSKRNFVCDCGTTRVSSGLPCTLRNDPKTGAKGARSQEPAPENNYNHNFQNRFCGCGENYNAFEEKGTMFQCLGLGTVETGGCGEDWWHPECLIGLPRNWYKKAKAATEDVEAAKQNGEADDNDDEDTPLPPGFPAEDDFETFLCYKCVESNPWLKRYAGTPGFLPAVYKEGRLSKGPEEQRTSAEPPNAPSEPLTNTKKRKADDDDTTEAKETDVPSAKRTKSEVDNEEIPTESKPDTTQREPAKPKHESLPNPPPSGAFSLFLKEDFRERFCRCPECYPNLAKYPQLREEEETYEPPLSEDGDANGGGSTGTGSIYDRGEAALSNIDRVRAIEGAMVYNHLRDKVKEFLKPFAESGTAVSAEDIKAYFEKLRGDEKPIKDAAAGQASASSGNGGNEKDEGGDGRKEQSGY
ncbi:putative metaphase-anaphase transition protein (Mlo2) [Aspergillus novofumigatus IBT 16806]|uniref:Putative metaphase-anaphase transition protein n=1 Tax=Aspergillus novofumigatus (strain IBT 16806) TaxID=1392255 RepID=A0A2I1BTQ9_ASPN1|nr:putative metaphase-anaphase transition protein [Aspergillus novofumigatus IBT 16806]PKX88785.1 putative metaphase-anaphase transition protein [Aspergillus novofumigatus IBT 16806]